MKKGNSSSIEKLRYGYRVICELGSTFNTSNLHVFYVKQCLEKQHICLLWFKLIDYSASGNFWSYTLNPLAGHSIANTSLYRDILLHPLTTSPIQLALNLSNRELAPSDLI